MTSAEVLKTITFDKLIQTAADADWREPIRQSKTGLAIEPTTTGHTGALDGIDRL